MAYYTIIPSPVGEITLLSADGVSLAGLWLDSQKPETEGAEKAEYLPVFAETQNWLNRYFAGEKPLPEEIPLKPAGTAFQRQVWNVLRRIPYGTTVSYGEIAEEIGCRSAQAVGQAVGRNPLSVIVPCHRVIGKNGSLTGYAGGLDKKRELLKLEGIL
ncbi:MAG: methylated-DNA--[Clostridia bacterium]|nr:methylated-DNA--[protein]-cysteine S-methyltransferase [Clostridia bacterium]